MNQPRSKPTILVVDDTPDNIDLLCAVLEDDYRTKIAVNGERALKIANGDDQPDLILLDIMMPGMSGYDVCKELKAHPATRDIPVIFVTAMSETVDEQLGLGLGAADYITKPISAPIVLARIKTQLSMKRVHDFLRDQNHFLETEVEIRTREIVALQDVTIHTMASLAETRDSETGNHIRRTAHYVKTLAEKLRHHPRFSAFLTDKNIELLFKSAPLHDIGKVGIPDRILLKPGRFEPYEMEIMKTHTTLGRDAIEAAERELGITVDFLKYAKEIAYGHQEKWDGSGYPLGLVGVGIPDRILLKPGRFEPHEMEIMKTHTTLGRDAIEAAERELGITVDFLKYAKEIAYGHQEKWDGSGYPLGLAGDDIPISARLMAVADVYDALISRRVYKEGMSHEAAVAIITEGRGQHFDPDMVDAFLSLQAEFIAIAKAYADSDHDMEKKREKVELFAPPAEPQRG